MLYNHIMSIIDRHELDRVIKILKTKGYIMLRGNKTCLYFYNDKKDVDILIFK